MYGCKYKLPHLLKLQPSNLHLLSFRVYNDKRVLVKKAKFLSTVSQPLIPLHCLFIIWFYLIISANKFKINIELLSFSIFCFVLFCNKLLNFEMFLSDCREQETVVLLHHGCLARLQIGADWPQMRKVWDF